MSDLFSLPPGDVNSEEALKLIAKAEDMVQRFRDLDYIVMPNAATILLTIPDEKRPMSISDSLWKSIAVYEDAKSKYPSQTDLADIRIRYALAHVVLTTIDRARAYGVVEEGQGLARKLREYQAENARLRADNEVLSEANQGLVQRFPDLRKKYEGEEQPP